MIEWLIQFVRNLFLPSTIRRGEGIWSSDGRFLLYYPEKKEKELEEAEELAKSLNIYYKLKEPQANQSQTYKQNPWALHGIKEKTFCPKCGEQEPDCICTTRWNTAHWHILD